MELNMGSVDRIVRAIVGAVLLLVVFLGPLGVTAQWILGIIGVVMLGTAAVGFCPAYLPLGIRTCPKTGEGKREE